ncbi:membrane hypothetical protein [uncultured Paludibacter sp.]|nr:membrane hypothetical protein [uncultured Paludibacter sp.]
MDAIIKIFERLLIDKSKNLGQKSWRLLLVLSILLTTDYFTNFTHHIYVSNKLETLEKISSLKKEYQNDSVFLLQLNSIELKYKESKHYYYYVNYYYLRFLNFSKSLFKSETKEITKAEIKKDTVITNKPIRSSLWMFISSNLFFIILTVIILFLPLFSKEMRKKESILGLFIFLIIFALIMSFTTWTSYKIPIIYDTPKYNYILNFIIHITFIVLFSISVGKFAEKQTKKETPNR